MTSIWYYSDTGQESHGPIPIEDLGRILRSSDDSSNYLVWSPGMSDWAKAGSLPDLKKYFQLPSARSIETSSIDTHARTDQASTHLHPWRRYFARTFDLYFFILIFFAFLGITFPSFFTTTERSMGAGGSQFLYSVVAIASYVIFESFCLNVFGRTIGKLLYGIRLETKAGTPITLSAAFKRSLAVWFRGLGLGIPIVSLVTQITAYDKLNKEGQTSWDRDFNFAVLHRHLSILRWILILLAWVFLVSIWVLLIAIGSR